MQKINIEDFNYELPDHRIAKYPAEQRSASKLLVRRTDGGISHTVFNRIGEVLPENTMLVFNNTRVVRARVIMHK
ncbi:MAG: S-adenosylmethionine:tRNA ribosyltransferase-isomerase, partial [Rikenellaceae bacterium]|nr:S-adenosylmethionine:tRNA ribosyltransferase-isomerase [Rikenellaceae bacterium]